MTTENVSPQPSVTPPVAPDPKVVEDGKAFAILSYALGIIGLPFFLVPLIMRNNAYSLYHAKQCLLLWLAGMVVFAAGFALMFVCIGLVLMPIAGVGLLVLDILGLVNAINGRQQPVPLVGKFADEWFKGITPV
jgi:uncharacterized membrane protein